MNWKSRGLKSGFITIFFLETVDEPMRRHDVSGRGVQLHLLRRLSDRKRGGIEWPDFVQILLDKLTKYLATLGRREEPGKSVPSQEHLDERMAAQLR